MIGMGDISSLIERANEKIKQSDQEKRPINQWYRAKWPLQDFADQMDMVGKMGSLSQLIKYMPGFNGANISQDMIEKGESEVKYFRAIINSMTPKERVNPRILEVSRKKRVANGAGVTVEQINLLLQRFEQVQQYAKLFKKRGLFGRQF